MTPVVLVEHPIPSERFTAPREPRSEFARRTAAAASRRIAAKRAEIAARLSKETP